MIADLVVDSLAAYRLTRLVTDDEITSAVRNNAHKAHEKIGYLVNCPYCTGVWAAAAVASGLLPSKVRWILAVSAVVAIYYDLSDRLE